MRSALRLLALLCIGAAPALAQPAPPVAPLNPVSDTLYGTVVVDPYRWMERGDTTFTGWLKAQASYTSSVLAGLPDRAALLARIRELDHAGAAVPAAQRFGGRYFYLKSEADADNRRLYVRDERTGAERLLVDLERLTAGGVHYSIDYFAPSLDGRYVAYGISPSGSEASVLHVIESATGKELGERIDRAQFVVTSWRRDGRSFYYNRLAEMAPGAPQSDKYLRSRAYLHTLGTDPERDVPVFGYGVSPRVKAAETDVGLVFEAPASPLYVFGVLLHGVQSEGTIFVAPADSLAGAATPWRKLADVEDAVTIFDARGDDVYLLTHRDASRFKIIRTSLSRPNLAHATVVVPPGRQVLQNVGVASDALYVQGLDGGIGRLWRVPFGGRPEPVALPFDGAIGFMFTNPELPGVLVQLQSWTKPPLWYTYDPAARRFADTKLVAPSPVDFSGVEAVEVQARSADGTMVPLSIVYKKGIALDGSHPTWLSGYGAHGTTIDPYFTPTRLAWLERGGVFAYAHVRGGGEFGQDWYEGGKLLTKQHTIDDFLACAQYLVDHRYTSPARLAGEGTSAGGITIGGAITQRPELFGAALIRVGVSNALRFEFSENAVATMEFGSVKTPEGFKALYAMDAYHHVKPGTPYPAVLLTAGATDPRVSPWQVAKMAARLQASTTSGKPVLLRVDYDAGHGLGSTKSQRDEELADEEAFLLWQLIPPERRVVP